MDERPPMERAMSTDVVMDILLSHLEVEDLLNCRKVSKFWNKAASSVLRKRSTMIYKKISKEAELMELEKCMKQNSDFPFAGFRFDLSWMLNCPRAKQFFKNYGEKFTSLDLVASKETRIQDLAPFLNHLRRLSTLEMHWPPHSTELLDSAAGQKGGRILNLPSLRTLKVSSELNQDGLREIVKAASPSLRIECSPATYGLLRQLKSVGKLQAVSVMVVFGRNEGEDYALRRVAELLSTDTPALTKLDLSTDIFSLDGLMKLLISSQHTLKELHVSSGICTSQFSSECPVLTKLTTLSLYVADEPEEYVFQGSQGHKFPALLELIIDMNDEYDPSLANLTDGLFIVPSLKRIKLLNHVDKAGIVQLARSFPNVIDVDLPHHVYDFGYSNDRDPFDIWSIGAFKFLEKLKIRHCNVKWPAKSYDNYDNQIDFKKFKIMNMDSFLTGIPITICENLRKHNQQNLKDSPFNEILRDSPNILQLKNLKELIISVYLDVEDKWNELPEESPFISMVSVWYALKMMPNLEARFVYEPRLPSPCFEEKYRDQAVTVLKAAFKHVQPYLELKPCFY